MSEVLQNSVASSSSSLELESSTGDAETLTNSAMTEISATGSAMSQESSALAGQNSVVSFSTNTQTNTGGAPAASTGAHTGTSSGDGESSMIGSMIRSTLQAPITTAIKLDFQWPGLHYCNRNAVPLFSSSSSSTSSNTGAVIGGIVSGIVGLAFILVALFVIYRRWQRKHDLDMTFDRFDGDFDPDRIAVRKNGCTRKNSKGNSRKWAGGGRSDGSDMEVLMTGITVGRYGGGSPVASAPVQGVPVYSYVHPYSNPLPHQMLLPNEMVFPAVPPHELPPQLLLSLPHLTHPLFAPVRAQTGTPPLISPTRPSSSLMHENLIIADIRSESPLPLLAQQS
ncbi:hypothetical protein GYMLUDRAFT_248340 [Collybiopsis luxurians FD-317 M1]|uniref:Uncharacterized protein n=1 Tax=Collybiopsis luxurians FD-317 M1 TaxID=944289 RepID=A0A0D0BM70_9AGAR|nr:hypothetical protein GYMLUDRAFT_248340 [Collybiopsis luxurians FD-317 M1]